MAVYRPRVVYNATTINFSISQKLWRYRDVGEGGFARISSTGIGESYEIRRDSIAIVTLRFTWAEWNTHVRPWLRYQQQNMGTSFTFRFDQDDAATQFTVYLLKPGEGEPIEFSHEEGNILSIEVEIMAAPGSTFTTAPY